MRLSKDKSLLTSLNSIGTVILKILMARSPNLFPRTSRGPINFSQIYRISSLLQLDKLVVEKEIIKASLVNKHFDIPLSICQKIIDDRHYGHLNWSSHTASFENVAAATSVTKTTHFSEDLIDLLMYTIRSTAYYVGTKLRTENNNSSNTMHPNDPSGTLMNDPKAFKELVLQITNICRSATTLFANSLHICGQYQHYHSN